ncbi:MAG: hypothetical protein IJD92_04320 [Bacilli bacterium]|nr:hypothetical protein [Bacilli bacterium]
MEGTVTNSMSEIVSALNTGITSETLFGTVADLMPWVITLTIASLGLYFLRKLVKGAAKGKVRF